MTIAEAMRAYSFRLHGVTWVWTIAKPMPAVAVVELVVDPVPRGAVARPVLDRVRRLGYVRCRGGPASAFGRPARAAGTSAPGAGGVGVSAARPGLVGGLHRRRRRP